jgi:Ca2+-transporting ATPase
VSKDVEPIAGEAVLGDRYNMVFSGTAATYGHAKAVVTATGMQTEMGHIAGMLQLGFVSKLIFDGQRVSAMLGG